MVVAYVASRFPEVTQTWMLRELDAVTADPDIECELLSLFPPMKRTATVHPAAQPWMERFRRPGTAESLRALAWWLGHTPLDLVGSFVTIVGAYGRRPRDMVKALVTLAVAAAHARTLTELRVDRLHAHTATWPTLAAWVCHRLTGIPYSFTAHAHDIFVDQSFLRERLAAADFAVAISDFNRGFLAAYGGDRPTPVYVIRCGIDLAAHPFEPRAPEPGDPVRALSVGGLKDYKGHSVLLEALASGVPELERVSLDLVGDGPLREDLQAQASRLGLADRVRFHGSLPEPEVAALFGRADLFVLPSVIAPDGTMEGLPVVLMEALATGVPTVATRVSAVPELIRDGETGLLAQPESASDLRRAIEALLADPAAARSRAGAGRELIEQEYDAARCGAALGRLFRGASPYSTASPRTGGTRTAPPARTPE